MNIEELHIGSHVMFEYCDCVVDGLMKDRVHLEGEPDDFWVSPYELDPIPNNTSTDPQSSKKNNDYTKPSEKRRFVVGDVVLYDDFDKCNNNRPWTGIMLIKSFDFDADMACRCSVGRSIYSNTVYGDFAPGVRRLRYAKKHHIKKFIKDIQKLKNAFLYTNEINFLKNKIKD